MSFADVLDVLYEDNHLIAVNKPCGWPSAHFGGAEETMDRVVKAYLKEKYGKPGKVFLGVVHRLDKPVSGVLLFARTSKGAARLSEQFRENLVEKVYWAVVEGLEARPRRHARRLAPQGLRRRRRRGGPAGHRGGRAGAPALRDEGRARRADVARNPAADRANTPAEGPAGVPRPADLRGPQVRLAATRSGPGSACTPGR